MQHAPQADRPENGGVVTTAAGRGHVSLALKGGHLIGLENGRGALVQLVSGQLWITQSGDYRDIIVEPGKSFRLDRDGLAVVMAIIDAQIVVTPHDGTMLGRLRFDRSRQ